MSSKIAIHHVRKAVKQVSKPKIIEDSMNLHQGVSSDNVRVLLNVLRKACKKEIAACYALAKANAALKRKMLFVLQETAIQKRIASFIALEVDRKVEKQWIITMICTARSFRKKGMGRYLLQLVTHIICTQFHATLVVNALPSVTNFYRKHGFQIVSRNDKQVILKRDP